MAATATLAAAGALSGCASGERVARAQRPDCPGKIVCPLTGELVCIDRCPAEAGAKGDVKLAAMQPGSCCAAAK